MSANYNSQSLKFIPALMEHKALGSLPKNSLPSWEQLSEYRCQMVVDQYENQDGQIAEQCRLQFLHKRTGACFTINITDLSFVKNTSYLFEWDKNKQFTDVSVSDQVSLRMSTNCLNYNQPNFIREYLSYEKREQIANDQERAKKQQMVSTSPKSQYSKKSMMMKKEQSKKQEILDSDCIKKEESEGSDFGSWIEQEFSQPQKKVETISYTPPERTYTEYRGYDDRNLIDYSESTKINVRFKLLEFFKVPENRKRRIPQIRQFLRKQHYNVPEKPLKELIKDICVSHIMDRNKGYILKDTYLTKEEIQLREEQKQREIFEKKEKDRKKRSKKQTKEPLHESFLDSISEARSNQAGRSAAARKKESK